MNIATRTTSDWQAADAAHYLHPFTDFKALADKGSRVITRGDNIYLWDSEGRKILDAMSGLWCVNVGYGQDALVDAATEQLRTLPFYNSFFQTTTVPAIELSELLAQVTPPQFQHVFFTGSGSEGNDTIVRMVRRYWELQGRPERSVIISRNNAYHGSTLAGGSLGGMSGIHALGGVMPGVVHIEQPFWFAHGQGMSRDDFGLQAAHWLEEKILAVGADKVAFMPRQFTADDLDTMQMVRCAFDPQNISNPGKVFPTPRLCGEVPGRHKGAHPLAEAGIAEVF